MAAEWGSGAVCRLVIGGEVVNRPSWLDYFVRRFQDRWETNPQYRAMVSGVVGLALILTLCTCTGLMTVVSNSALASLGLTNGSGITHNSTPIPVPAKLDRAPTSRPRTFNNVPTGGATPAGSPIASSQTAIHPLAPIHRCRLIHQSVTATVVVAVVVAVAVAVAVVDRSPPHSRPFPGWPARPGISFSTPAPLTSA